jgi:hypothetical protein
MEKMLYGALAFGKRTGPDACSTVEARTVDGSTRIVMLTAVQGDLATPALEAIKGALAKVAQADESAVKKLAAAAPPPPYASGVAVVLLAGARAFVASTGAARCYLERGGTLEAIAAGTYELAPGDAILAASHAGLPAGQAFFDAGVPSAPDDDFSNNRLDAALETALSRHAGAFIAVAAARVGA